MIKNEEMWKFRYMDNVRIVDKDGNVNVGSVIEILDGDEFGCDDELKLEPDNGRIKTFTANDISEISIVDAGKRGCGSGDGDSEVRESGGYRSHFSDRCQN